MEEHAEPVPSTVVPQAPELQLWPEVQPTQAAPPVPQALAVVPAAQEPF